MTRAARHLREPGRELTGFPRRKLPAGLTVYRCHAALNGPWWFASRPDGEPGGRFDLAPPDGTCYVGLDETTTVLERFGPEFHDQGFVFEESAQHARVSTLNLAEDVDAADTTDGRAAGWITRELSSSPDYDVPQRWAAAFFADGFTGIYYQSRFTTGHDQFAAGLFGKAGTRPWPQGRLADDVTSLLETAGIEVLRPLRLRDLRKAQRPPPRSY